MVKLRPYQQEAVDAILSHDKGIVSAATGSGKTTIMSQAIASYHATSSARSLILVHTRSLLDQTARRLREETSLSVTIYYGEEKQGLTGDVVVATYQSLQFVIEAGAIEHCHFDHIHVDEAHNVRRQDYQRVIAFFEPKTLHGYTATLEGNGRDEIMSVFEREIFEIGMIDLIEKGYLSRMRILVSVSERAGVKDSEFYNRSKFETIRTMTSQNASVVKTIHFFSRNYRFEMIDDWDLLHENTYAEVSASTPRQARHEIFDRFHDPDSGLDHLLANRVLNEGIDLPITNALVFHESMGDYRAIAQRFGRGLRVWSGNKAQTTVIMVFVDSRDHAHLNALQEFVSGIRQDTKNSEKVRVMEMKTGDLEDSSQNVPDEAPVTITFLDITEEMFNRTGSKRAHVDLDEFIETMAEKGIDSHTKYKVMRGFLSTPSNPSEYYGISARNLWNRVRSRLGVDCLTTYDFTLEQFTNDMVAGKVHTSGQYAKRHREFQYGSNPHLKLGLSAKRLWQSVRDAAGIPTRVTDFEFDAFVKNMVAAGITSHSAFRSRSGDHNYPPNPHKYLDMKSPDLWKAVRDQAGIYRPETDFTREELVSKLANAGISSLREYRGRRKALGLPASPHDLLGMTSSELFAEVRERLGIEIPHYGFTIEEFVGAMVSLAIYGSGKYARSGQSQRYGTAPHRRLGVSSKDLWVRVRAEAEHRDAA